jgi:glucokinase
MPPLKTGGTKLVAEIGGTNTRLALFDPDRHALRARRPYINEQYASLEDIIDTWLKDLGEAPPLECCLAVAAPPPFDDQVAMLNIDWRFSLSALVERFGFHRVSCINDFEGNAYALPHLGAGDVTTLQPGACPPASKLATLGPGTGLGGSTLDTRGPAPIACASEPGHMGLAPATALELALFQYLQPRHGEVYAELLLSGPGLRRLCQSLAAVRGEDLPHLTPQDISARALAGECGLCVDTLHIFCALLGSVCGDFVLANGAYGGLYVAGGIIPAMVDFLRASAFAERFREKGKMGDRLARVPLHVITSHDTGLIGAAHAPMPESGRPTLSS